MSRGLLPRWNNKGREGRVKMEFNEQIEKEFLAIHNKLQNAIENMDDTRDLTLTNIRDIERAMYYIRHTFSFRPPHDGTEYYNDYVLRDSLE